MTRAQLLADTVARPERGADGRIVAWWLMSRQAGGWAASGRRFRSLREITEEYAVTLGDWGSDAAGEFVHVRREATPPTPAVLLLAGVERQCACGARFRVVSLGEREDHEDAYPAVCPLCERRALSEIRGHRMDLLACAFGAACALLGALS